MDLYVLLPILAFLIPFSIGITLMITIHASMNKRAKKLQQGFNSIKPLVGKTLDEIQNVCGKPLRGTYVNGTSMYVWVGGKYQINLSFDADNICTQVNFETIL